MIYIFGANVCKFCKKQIQYLSNTYGANSNSWEYIDVSRNQDAIKVAQDFNLDSIPSIVVVNEENKLILSKEGTMPSDQIYNTIHKNNKKIPFSKEEIKKLSKGNKVIKILSYDPFLSKGDIVEANTYEDDTICGMKVESCIKYAISSRNFTQEEMNLYKKIGGRKDIAWKISLTK